MKAEIAIYRDMLANPSAEQWVGLAHELARAGYDGVPESPRQRTEAAKLIVRYQYGRLTEAQLDEILFPRKARPDKSNLR
jgi:hypothetical protein